MWVPTVRDHEEGVDDEDPLHATLIRSNVGQHKNLNGATLLSGASLFRSAILHLGKIDGSSGLVIPKTRGVLKTLKHLRHVLVPHGILLQIATARPSRRGLPFLSHENNKQDD